MKTLFLFFIVVMNSSFVCSKYRNNTCNPLEKFSNYDSINNWIVKDNYIQNNQRSIRSSPYTFYNLTDVERDQFLGNYPSSILSDNNNIYDLNDTEFDKFLGYLDGNQEPNHEDLEDIARNLVTEEFPPLSNAHNHDLPSIVDYRDINGERLV